MPLTRSAARAVQDASFETDKSTFEDAKEDIRFALSPSSEPFQLSSPPATPQPAKASRAKASPVKKAAPHTVHAEETAAAVPLPQSTRKRKRETLSKAEEIEDAEGGEVKQLSVRATKASRTTEGSPPNASPSKARKVSSSTSTKTSKASPAKRNGSKKQRGIDLQLLAQKIGIPGHDQPRLQYIGYGHIPGTTPFPDLQRPTPDEAEEVYKRLASIHGEVNLDDPLPPPSLTIAGCGDVPCVLDALIRTFLSSNTSASHSNAAIQGMVKQYGLATKGAMAGSIDYNAVYAAGQPVLQEAIKGGGMSARKSKSIFTLLEKVHAENQLWLSQKAKDPSLTLQNAAGQARFGRSLEEAAKLAQEDLESNPLSLEYINLLPTQDALLHMVEYHGIGIKTAACVAVYCLRRPVFPVDTHVQRFCQGLGWSRANTKGKWDDKLTFSHNEVMLPDHLKYGLHDLFWKHGTGCRKCRAGMVEGGAGWEDRCVLDGLVDRERMRNPDVVARKVAVMEEREDETEVEDED